MTHRKTNALLAELAPLLIQLKARFFKCVCKAKFARCLPHKLSHKSQTQNACKNLMSVGEIGVIGFALALLNVSATAGSCRSDDDEDDNDDDIGMKPTTRTQCPTLPQKVPRVIVCTTLHRHRVWHTTGFSTPLVDHWIGEALSRLSRHAWDTVDLLYPRAHTGRDATHRDIHKTPTLKSSSSPRHNLVFPT